MPFYFYVQSNLNGFVLDIEGSNKAPGSPVIAYPKNAPASDNQLWAFTPEGYIESKLNGFVLDVKASSKEAGAPVIAYPKNAPATPNQLWTLGSGGYIVTQLDGFVLDVKGSNKAPGTPIIVYPKNAPATPNQLWTLTWATAPAATPAAAAPATPTPKVTVTGLDCKSELVTITNGGTAPVDLSGWKIHDNGSANTFSFPAGTTLAAGASVSIRSGKTAPKAGEIAWKTNDVWNNAGDTATLVDPSGTAVSSKSA